MIPDMDASIGRRGRTDCSLTGYRSDGPRILASCEEDYVPLALVDIVILKEEELVHAIFLERAELDKQTDDGSEGALNHQILLPSDLLCVNLCLSATGSHALRTASRSSKKSRRVLSVRSCVLMACEAAFAAITSSR